MHDVKVTVYIDLSQQTKALYNRDITEDIAHNLTDDITSYLTDSWGLSTEDFFVLLEYKAEQTA